MVAKVQENGKDRQARLAEVLDALPEATRLRIIESVREQDVPLFSDLALHHMGPQLADDIQQGAAAGGLLHFRER